MKFIVMGRYDRIEARQGFEVVYDRSIWDEDLANSICERVNNAQAELDVKDKRIAELEAENARYKEFAWLAWMDDFTQQMSDYYSQENPKAYALVDSIIDEMNGGDTDDEFNHASETETP